MTRRRILPRLLAVGVLVLALAGCVRFQADLTLSPENTVDGTIVVAVALQDDSQDSRDAALTAAQQIEDELLGSLRDASGVTTSEYEEDDYLGSLIELDAVSLDAFSGQSEDSFQIVRDGDEFVFTGALDFSGESVPSEDEAADDNLTISITFPGPVSEHNGELTGTTVSWSTSVDQRLDMSARGAATPPGPPVLLIAAIVLAVLLVLAAIVGVLLFLRSRKAKAAALAPAATTEAPVVTPPAPVVDAAAEATADAAPKKPRAPRTPKAPPAPEA